MAYENLCMYCFEDLQGQSVCPHCGRDSHAAVPQIQMMPGTLVYHNRFLVGRALGQDAAGIVYSAYDTKRGNTLRLREYLPRDCAERLNDGTVVPSADREEQFEKGMRKLRASVEGVSDPKKRHFYFEENGTAFVAERGSAAAAAVGAAPAQAKSGGFKQIGVIVGIAAAVVVIAAIAIVSLVNGALRSSNDVVQNATLAPNTTTNLWAPEVTASPTPYVSPTFAALVDPEQSWMDYTYSGDVNKEFQNQLNQSSTATPKPTLGSDEDKYDTIGKNSSTAEVTGLQQRLASLGWLSAEKITGKYDSDTKQAVKDFQTYVNNTFQPAKKLSVDGIAGPQTLQWLYATEAVKPTPTPTPAVTPNPEDGTVDKDSSKTDIKAVQRKLMLLGLMEAGSDDGVYGTTTVAAVKKFQQRVNQLQGYEALQITGVVDPDTMAYLNYYVEWWESLQQATATPAPVLPTTPTPAPTDAPDQEEDKFHVDQNSPKESIKYVQQMLIAAGLLPEGSDDGKYGAGTATAMLKFQQYVNDYFQGDVLAENGVGDSLTLSYLEEFVSRGMTVPENKPTEAPTAVPTQEPTAVPTEVPTQAPTEVPTQAPTDAPDEEEDQFHVDADSPKESIKYVQQMLIEAGLLKAGSDDGDYGRGTTAAMLAFQQYVNDYYGGDVLEETGIGDALTLSYLEEFVSRGMTVPKNEPTEAPTAVPTETPTEAPEVKVNLSIGGAELMNGVYAVTGESITFNWSASGAVDSYYVYVYKQSGSALHQEEATQRTTGAFGADSLNPGEIYTIMIGALPAGGEESDMVWTQAQFGVPAAQTTPEPDPTATPEPDPTEVPGDGSVKPESSAEDIYRLQNLLISAGVLKDGGADGDYGKGTKNAVLAFQQYVNDYFGDAVLDESGIADATTMQYLQEFVNKGMSVPKEEPTAVPEPDPTEIPEPDPTEIPSDGSVKPESSAEEIYRLQNLLISAGVLKDGGADGDYGKGTKNAVLAFQQYVNDYFGDAVLDESGIADATTMQYLQEFVNKGMSVPKEEPTAVPEPDPTEIPEPDPTEIPSDGSVKPESSVEEIYRLQNLLISAGVLKDGGADGDYGKGTKNAVLAFQQYVNDYFGDAILDESGIADATTMQYLEDFVSRGLTVPKPEPTAAPEPDPTEVPEPDPTEAPKPMEDPKVSINYVPYDPMVEEVPQLDTSMPTVFSWTMNGDMQGYMLYMTNSVGQRKDLEKTYESFVELDLSTLPADVYTLWIGAVPVGAQSEADVIWSSVTFAVGN